MRIEVLRLEIAGDRELIDGMSSWWAAIHGYRHPHLDEALRRRLDQLRQAFGGSVDARLLDTPQTRRELAQATDLIGYFPYLDRVGVRTGQTRHPSDNTDEPARARLACEAGMTTASGMGAISSVMRSSP